MDSTTAVGSTQTAEQFLKTVKRRTRRKFTAEEKIRILLEGMKREVSTADLCRTESIHPHVYYSWLKDFMEGGKARLRGDSKRSATESEVGGLKRENERLKIVLAEHMLENVLLKKSLSGLEEPGGAQ
jgi:transposase